MEKLIIKILDEMETADGCDITTVINLFKKNGFNIYYGEGATKGCFVFKDLDFVIKFNLENNGSHRIDDCVGQELFIYEMAKERGLNKILIPTSKFYTNQNGIVFIKQRKISYVAEEQKGKLRDKYKIKDKNANDRFIYKVRGSFYQRATALDNDWLKRAIHIYGKKFIKEFAQFTIEYKINDLHCANIGYIGNKPVILDFSGF